MPQVTIIATVDGYEYSESGTYANVQAGYVAGFTNSGSSPWTTGQLLGAGPLYGLLQAQARYPLTVIPAAARIVAGSFQLTNSGTPTAGISDTILKGRDPGSSITSADYLAISSLAALSTLATIPTTSNGANQTYITAGTAALVSYIQANIGGNIGFSAVSANALAGTPPTGDERWNFKSIEDATPANRPALIVTYDLPRSYTAVIG